MAHTAEAPAATNGNGSAPPADGAARFEAAAAFFDRAVQAGCHDPDVLYLLALARKRQGKTAEARAALRRVARPDAGVLLQLGLQSLQEGLLAQAEGEFARAWEADPSSYEVCYNLLMTRLSLAQAEACAALIPKALELLPDRATASGERRFLAVLLGLLRVADRPAPDGRLAPFLGELTVDEELRLLGALRGLGRLDTTLALLRALVEARPSSGATREAYAEATLAKGKELMDRCAWTEAELLLKPLLRDRVPGRAVQLPLLNLLGCCACLTQDFESAARHFAAALKLSPNDPRLHQNLALTYEIQGNLEQADPHWGRFFDLLERGVPGPPDVPHYAGHLAFEGLARLAGRCVEKERFAGALTYVQRAQKLRPDDPDVLERLFHLYNQAKRPQDARRALDQLRQLKPADPQLDLYELDLTEVKGLNDIERLLGDIDRVLQRHPGDARVEERAVSMVGNVIPLMGNLCDQLTEQMGKVIDQVRGLPNYQVNWSAVREVMRDLLKEFQRLRRITGRCLPLVKSEEHRRVVRDLAEHIDRKMEACRSMMG
jgi:Flp pilus assembly protein TadD